MDRPTVRLAGLHRMGVEEEHGPDTVLAPRLEYVRICAPQCAFVIMTGRELNLYRFDWDCILKMDFTKSLRSWNLKTFVFLDAVHKYASRNIQSHTEGRIFLLRLLPGRNDGVMTHLLDKGGSHASITDASRLLFPPRPRTGNTSSVRMGVDR